VDKLKFHGTPSIQRDASRQKSTAEPLLQDRPEEPNHAEDRNILRHNIDVFRQQLDNNVVIHDSDPELQQTREL